MDKLCPICGKPFGPIRPWQEYCSLKCGARARGRRRNAKVRKPPKEKHMPAESTRPTPIRKPHGFDGYMKVDQDNIDSERFTCLCGETFADQKEFERHLESVST